MEAITSNEFLNSVLEAEAWKELSGKAAFTVEMLEKYADKLDWEEISRNDNICWTYEGLRKFAHKLDWESFSSNCPDSLICETALEKFTNHWCWKELSDRSCFYDNWTLLEKFADRADWNAVISNWNIEKPVEFYNKFQKYIPMSKFQNSRLWDALVEIRAKELINEVRGIK